MLQPGHFEGSFSDVGGLDLGHRFGRRPAGYSISFSWSSLVATGGGDAAYGPGMK